MDRGHLKHSCIAHYYGNANLNVVMRITHSLGCGSGTDVRAIRLCTF